jgi:hypothetical protein
MTKLIKIHEDCVDLTTGHWNWKFDT